MRKITLWTTREGMEQFENGETFPAKLQKDFYNVFPFSVSPVNIVDNIAGVLIIDTGSDSEFGY